VYLTGMREQGTLVATWGSQSSQQCRADFTLPNHSTYGGIADMHATCRQER
ncbi:TPA: FimD/PapC C-terminal domain-containing protein, partial [Enterobacter hormaechei subsp. xiangfangensis]